MEAYMLFGIAAVLTGGSCAAAALVSGAITLRRHRAAAAMQGDSRDVRGVISWRLRNGFAFVRPLVAALLGIPLVVKAADEAVGGLSLRGVTASRESVCSIAIVVLGCCGLLAGIAAGPVAAIAVMACFVVALFALSSNVRDKRNDAMRDAVPDALECMSVCFGSGFTLLQTFRQVAVDVPGPLGKTFGRSAHMLEMGSSAEAALSELRSGAQASELAFVAVALDVQHQSGGAMRQVLDAATDAVKGELSLRRSLRVQTAQAKLSARVVSVMPFVLIAAFSLVSPDFLTPFFSSPFGYALLALAVIMQAAGILLVRRALSVEGVS